MYTIVDFLRGFLPWLINYGGTFRTKFDRGHPAVFIITNNIQYFPSDTTRLCIHKNVITGLLVSVSQNHLSGPPVLRTLLVYSC